MLWGFFKKMVIADRVAVPVDWVFYEPENYHGLAFTIAGLLFTVQIYCDFSGYSDIAIGAAQVLGFRLSENFRAPFHAPTLPDWWKRYNITISHWFRDYIYIPLGGNRVSKARMYLNIFIVFLVSGLWHGSDWNFILWGAILGVMSIVFISLRKPFQALMSRSFLAGQKRVLKVCGALLTFIGVSIAFVFFRADNTADALYMISNLGTGWSDLMSFEALQATLKEMRFPMREVWITLFSLIVLELVHFYEERRDVRQMFVEKAKWFRWSFYYLIIMAILLFGDFSQSAFIYFQF